MGAYVFRSEWRLPADADRVYGVLVDVEGYPSWWPQVRRGRRIDDRSGELVCRSRLPYDLTFTLAREVEDAERRVLRANVSGDLRGFVQWTVTPDAAGALAVFDEDVDVGTSLLRAGGRFLRPLFRANHDHMMRGGEQGLRGHLGQRPGEGAR